jgi:hypothetical protein
MPTPCRAGKQYNQSTQTGSGVPRSLVALFMPRHEETDRNTYRTASYTNRTTEQHSINNRKDETPMA